MSFAIPQPPSASSDSGSSTSLTPTANGYSGSRGFADPSSSSTSSAPDSGSLFSSEESKFITDSLSSAESFDPFTIGAPGFKVPSLLPPGIGATTASNPSTSADDMMATNPNLSLSEAGTNHDMRTRSLSGQHALSSYSTNLPGSQDYPAASRLNSFNLYGHRPSGATPPAGPSNLTGSSYLSHLQNDHAYAHPAGRHASFSGASGMPMSASAAAAAGYGKNKAWQMEQLSFLEAQASRGQQQQGILAHGFPIDHHRRASSVMLNTQNPYDNILLHPSQHQHNPLQQHLAQQQARAPFYPGVTGAEENQAGLAMLGAQFPSSHNFGSMQHPSHVQQQQQQQAQQHAGMGGFSAQALAMLNGDAGLGAASALSGGDAEAAHGGMSTPKNRVNSSTPTAAKAASTGSPSHLVNLKRTSSGAPKTAPTQNSSLHTGPSGAVIRALGDLANLDLDLEGALRVLPSHLHPYFTPQRMEKKTQPHLAMLKQQHIENGLIDAKTGLEIKPEPTEENLKREAEEAEREKKKEHTLLTTEEKKANHIASEQKRRANIRKGYEMLCDIVPSLREALEREASSKGSKGAGEDSEGESGSEDEGDKKGGKSPSKKKKAAAAGKKGDEGGGGIEIDGEKIDGRAGPRSEAVVLMKSLDHIGALVEQYRGLLGRRNRARLAAAKKFGWNDLPNQPVPDVDRLLAIKVQEWWASHGDEEEGDEGEVDDELRFAGAGDVNDDEAEEEEETAKKKTPAKGKKSQSKKKKGSAAKNEDGDGMED